MRCSLRRWEKRRLRARQMHRHLPRRSSEGNSDITKPEVESRRAASRSESWSPARRDVIAEGPKANLWLLSNL